MKILHSQYQSYHNPNYNGKNKLVYYCTVQIKVDIKISIIKFMKNEFNIYGIKIKEPKKIIGPIYIIDICYIFLFYFLININIIIIIIKIQYTSFMKTIQYNPSIHSVYMYLLFPLVVAVGFIQVFIFKLPFMSIFMIYGLIPMLDKIFSQDWLNPTHKQIMELQKNYKFKLALYLSIILDWLALFRGFILDDRTQKTLLFKILTAFLMINLSSTGFLIAHQLFHKQEYFDKVIGTLHQIKNLYMHFTIQHLYGHHKNVATPQDPASAQKGITVYQFVPRCIIGSYISAFKLSPKFVTLTSLISVAVIGCFYKYKGLQQTFWFLIWAIGSIVYLETINYIQHYGLRRKMNPDGTYQKVTIRHSWNAPHRMSNYLFFKLQRHSDHHQNSLKPYQTLCSLPDSPQLPHGYLICIVMAYFPKTWFEIMDPLVQEYEKSQKGTNLKALNIAEKKADEFVNHIFTATLILTIIEFIYFKMI